MKFINWLLLLTVLLVGDCTSLFAQKKKGKKINIEEPKYAFTINGETDGYDNGYVIFIPLLDAAKRDTIKVINKKFIYKGVISEASAYNYLRHDGQSGLFFIDTGNHNMIIDYVSNKGFGITASPTQESYNKFMSAINPYFEARQIYANQQSDSAELYRNAIENNIQFLFNQYLADTLSAPASVAYLTMSNVEQTKGNANAVMEQMWNQITPAARAHGMGKRARRLLDLFSADEVGKIAPDFTLVDSAGNKVKLSDYRGKKYVLVDFWATWCGPCRAEFPVLKAAQTKYAPKDLVILGVSIDADKQKWKTMLAQPEFTNWQHVWDDIRSADAVSQKLYYVPSIPRNFLIDKEGRVIARNLRGANVEVTLNKLFQ